MHLKLLSLHGWLALLLLSTSLTLTGCPTPRGDDDDDDELPGDDDDDAAADDDDASGDDDDASPEDEDGDGFSPADGDCDDGDASIHPDAGEVCDEIDNDCDDEIDEGVAETYYEDADHDGFGDPLSTLDACEAPDGFVADSSDCDDLDPLINPEAEEVCDGADNDCDGGIDTDLLQRVYVDADGDGYGDDASPSEACGEGDGYVFDNNDCDDSDAAVHPDAGEVCDGEDNDCDLDVDEGVTTAFFQDSDADGYGDALVQVDACEAPEGFVADASDCDDESDVTWPGAPEQCDELDNDCDTTVDEGVSETYFLDADSDGFGDDTFTAVGCSLPVGYSTQGGDCDDLEPLANPSAVEVCDTFDNDCDGLVDEDGLTEFFVDADGDGFGAGFPMLACEAPAQTVTLDGDCDDGEALANPDGVEICDTIDNDCDGQTDEFVELAIYLDADGDGYGDSFFTAGCEAGDGESLTDDDCDDGDASIHPGAVDAPGDGIDADCDGIDPSLPLGQVCLDNDVVLVSGDLIDGELSAASSTNGPRANTAYDDYELTLAAGQTVTIDLHSEQLDTSLYVLDVACATLATNDDGGIGSSSALVFTAPADGIYTVVATAASSVPAEQYGAYRLRLSEGDAGGACLAGSSVIGIGEDAELTLSSANTDGPRGNGYAYQDYGIYLQTGETISTQLSSEDFPAWIGVLDADCNEVASADGTSYTPNARLVFTASEAGNYTVVFGTDEAGETGSMHAQVAAGSLGTNCFSDPANATLPREYLEAQLSGGDLDENGPLGDGFYWDDYEFIAGPAEDLSIHAVSLATDLYVELYDENCDLLSTTSEDGFDFSGEEGVSADLDDWAQIVSAAISATDAGVLGRTLVSASQVDGWTLCGADNRSLVPNEMVHGLIDNEDPSTSPYLGNRWDDYEVYLEAGDRLDLVVDAIAFDPALAVLDGTCSVVATNADGATDDGATIAWTAPESGTYTVVVASETSGGAGEYYLQFASEEIDGCSDWSDADVIGAGLATYNGTLATNDESGYRTTWGSHYHDDIDLFLFVGQTIQIDLGGSLDNYLYLLDENCTQVDSDDDSGPGLDSMIVYTAPATGVYTVIATTWNPGATGSYDLTIEALNEF